MVLAVAFLCVSVPLAAPGAALVAGAGSAGPDAPRWLLGIFGDGFGLSPGAYLGLLYAAVGLWVCLLVLARDLGPRRVAVVAGLSIALFVLAPPLLSLDVFSYIAYARLGVEHGLNPYQHAPAAIPFDEAAARVRDYRDAVSVYGPLFTLGSYPLGALGVPAALWSLKALAGLAIAADRSDRAPGSRRSAASSPPPPRSSSRSTRSSSSTSSAGATTMP